MSSKNQVLSFKHPYSKLNHVEFYTIRRYGDRYEINQDLDVFVKHLFAGICSVIGKLELNLSWISTKFLLYDTDQPTRKKAIDLLSSFYQKPILPSEKLTIINCRWYWWTQTVVKGKSKKQEVKSNG